MTPEDFYKNYKVKEKMKDVSKWTTLVHEYLADAGFDDMLFIVRETYDAIEVDFDDKEAVYFIIEDIEKTKYKEHFVVDYKKSAMTKRHTAIFMWLND